MNNDLISRKELRKAFKECPFFTEVYLYYARQLIDNAPTVEQSYQEPKDYIRNKLDYSRTQGEWTGVVYTDNGIGVGMCNHCGIHRTIDNFCPNCGADMRGGKDNEAR